jgi:FkbM family methyltransferase
MNSATNWHGSDNWDSLVFGPYQASLKDRLLTKLNESFLKGTVIVPRHIDCEFQNISEGLLEELPSIYNLLADEFSKSTLVKLISYRILGHKKVRLPVSTDSYSSQREFPRSLIKSRDVIRIKYKDWVLEHFALAKIGYPIEIYDLPAGVHIVFMLKQYEYGKRSPAIKAKAGDYVIDAGGGWGDTALYFAHEVGEAGRVYAFEFTPDSLEVLYRNLDLNARLSQRIKVVPRALWERSGEVLIYYPHGPATTVAVDQTDRQDTLQVSTLSIDDFVKEEKVPRVDFIKMDIEGAELSALQGAEDTIRAFRPTLAISAYHKWDDLAVIPQYLDKLNLGYEFFLDHFTPHRAETVVFATPKFHD